MQARDGNARPVGHHASDVVLSDFFAEQCGLSLRFVRGFGEGLMLQLLLQIRDETILDLPGPPKSPRRWAFPRSGPRASISSFPLPTAVPGFLFFRPLAFRGGGLSFRLGDFFLRLFRPGLSG
ncbi:MAG TPA: hypothetical protein DCP71_09185, partial [Verrucomicrobiales bacterium]|nr:hypothetical protein [Verrucomicrobiales bacterium]